MSFRIDDILKRESSASPPNSAKRETTIKEQSSPPTTPPTTRDQKSTDPWFGLSHTNSILQQTLLNRNYPYYRSVSDCPNSKLYSNALYNCDKVFMPYNHLDPYADKGKTDQLDSMDFLINFIKRFFYYVINLLSTEKNIFRGCN